METANFIKEREKMQKMKELKSIAPNLSVATLKIEIEKSGKYVCTTPCICCIFINDETCACNAGRYDYHWQDILHYDFKKELITINDLSKFKNGNKK